MPDEDLAGTYYFTLNLGGAEAAGFFAECTGLTSESAVVEHTASDANGKSYIQKFPGQLKWSNITLKRGIDKKMELWTWRKDVVDGKVADSRKDGTISVVDWEGNAVMTFKFIRAWPCRYSSPGLNAGGNEILVEELEIAHEGFEREET
jgi:phage tail-like protein